MRVFYVTIEDLSLGQVSGKVHFRAIANELRNLGHDVSIVSPRYSRQRDVQFDGIEGIHPRILGKNAFGVLSFELWMLVMLPWWRIRHRPSVMLVRGGGPGLIPGAVFLLSRCLGIPVVLECNGITWREREQLGSASLTIASIRCSAWQQARAANRIISVTKEIGRAYAELARLGEESWVEVPNGTYPDDYVPNAVERHRVRNELGISPDSLVIGYVGVFSPWHGLKDVVTAAEVLKREGIDDVAFLLVGDGGVWREIEALRTAKRLKNVFLTGRATRDQIKTYLTAFDVGLCVNRTDLDWSPLKLFEYLAAGLPVVGSSFPHFMDVLRADEIGIALDEVSTESFVAAIETIKANPSKWREIGERNRIVAREKYSWRRAAERVVDVLEDVCSEP